MRALKRRYPMIKIYEDYNTTEILSRKIDDYAEYEATVRAILADVAKRGDDALFDYNLKFDGCAVKELEVSKEEMDAAESALSTIFSTVFLLGTILALLGLALLDPVLAFLGLGPAEAALAAEYQKTALIGTPILFMSVAAQIMT